MRTDNAVFSRMTPVSDGQGGTIGTPTDVFACRVELMPLKASRTQEGGQLSLKGAYQLKFWNDPAYVPQIGDTITCQGISLSIQQCIPADATRRKWLVTALSI